MLRAVTEFAKAHNIPCEISLEERMACGIGACLGCAVELYGENGKTYMGHVVRSSPSVPGGKGGILMADLKVSVTVSSSIVR